MQLWRLASIGVVALVAAQWFRLDKEVAGADRKVAPAAEVAYVPPVDALRIASFGNQGFVADLLFLRAAHYFVDHLITDSRLPWLDLYMEAVWGLDARIRQTYRWAAQVLKFGQRIDDEVGARANLFARIGLTEFPDDAWLYHEIAFNLRYSITPKDEADDKRLRALALRYLETAYSFPSFAFDPNYLVSQFQRAGRDDDSVQAALDTYLQATEEQRATMRVLLETRDKARLARELAWLDLVQRRDWPWAQPGLALFLGPRRRTAPPLHPERAEQWFAEAPVDDALRQRLALRAVAPPDRGGWLPDEVDGQDLPEPASAAAR